MNQILFATGIYGLFGSVLMVIFHFLPELIEIHSKKHLPFFIYTDEKELSQAVKTYNFYCNLWSFKLISTGFIIMIFYSLFSKEYLGSSWNIVFVVLDAVILSIIATWGITDIHKNSIGPRKLSLTSVYFGLSSIIYIMLMAINYVYYESTKIDFIDNILLISALFSQIIFSALFVYRYRLLKLHEQLKTYK